jgi:hypothetical protein
MLRVLLRFVPGLLAACLGGVAGYFLTLWISQKGFYAPVFPGALAGLACGFCSVDHSKVRGVLCALIALAAGVLSYWLLFSPPFETDGSLSDLVAHAHQLNPVTQIMLVLGALLGFWWGRESTCPWRDRFASTAKPDRPLIDE